MSHDITYEGVSKINSGYTEKYKPLFCISLQFVSVSPAKTTYLGYWCIQLGSFSIKKKVKDPHESVPTYIGNSFKLIVLKIYFCEDLYRGLDSFSMVSKRE